ncbi:winged helix-turn-helix domain-containing protein [Schlesneria sp.]|uniref:winged helix-turn-helix domain-containing protein n=1 Tax=Schlesneria sp. TaxID=2762018 RepID=UPI002F06534A
MSKKPAAKSKTTAQTEAKITKVAKGEIYETHHAEMLEVTNARLKDEGDLGISFEGIAITFNGVTGKAERSKTTDRYYLDNLARKLTKAEYDEWLEIGKREAEATAAAEATLATKAPAKTTKPKTEKPKASPSGKMSALDAAAKVLGESAEPLTSKGMIDAMAAKGYWQSPGGKTPHATLYAAILREITTKGEESRFIKTERGHFALNGKTAS